MNLLDTEIGFFTLDIPKTLKAFREAFPADGVVAKGVREDLISSLRGLPEESLYTAYVFQSFQGDEYLVSDALIEEIERNIMLTNDLNDLKRYWTLKNHVWPSCDHWIHEAPFFYLPLDLCQQLYPKIESQMVEMSIFQDFLPNTAFGTWEYFHADGVELYQGLENAGADSAILALTRQFDAQEIYVAIRTS